MASAIWRGSLATRLRIASGLILFTYAFFHFINVGLGLIDPVWMEEFQDARQVFSRSLTGTVILYTALLVHAGLALLSLARRRTLRMGRAEAVQVVLGLLIPLQLIAHVVHTRYAHEVYGVQDEMSYLIILMWPNISVWQQSALLLVVWTHGCIGLHFWLRLTSWWKAWLPWMIGLAVLVPAFALAGLLTEGRRMFAIFSDDALRPGYMEAYNWPDLATFGALFEVKDLGLAVFWGLLALTAASYAGRKLLRRRNAVRVRYVDGPEIVSERGLTLLQMSRLHGIPHTALCGGKGRCTTCRVVIEEGLDLLHPPSEMELASLRAVKAPPNTRLACQIRPTDPATVFRVFRPEGGRNRAHASQGQEGQLAVLFLDMRGFTARTTGQLPYDVVFLLNRFFDAIVPSVTGAGGTVDKYLGDGFLAVFEARDAATSARAGLEAARSIGAALKLFNRTLAAEGAAPVRIGMGLHLGNLVLGEIGAGGHAPRTIIGDTVNAASRLEAETKALGVELLISEAVLQAAGVDASMLDLQEFSLRGVPEPVLALPVPDAASLSLPQIATEHNSA
ncbi:adenylate/guanylate cyclase domain-containing protein [Ruegeria aquimaris]|uniref:Adenylate/guanylate cyclase domain-containing protein n=1 Tax=Ruegeria aquimaris TaxID=2984333 RepID=A0ABT3AJ40_9RHOB|nr:adenylate/guanylate cyclase domain-containing protein [Ruegeria sp. XHP0148]MCV2888663.1 adenylate/guanylate cyclase domain-containing protein [Ruegeria sp. XHP0148]